MPTFIRLTDYRSSDDKEKGFFDSQNKYVADQNDFEKIPTNPIAYWVSDKAIQILSENESLSEIAKPRKGLVTLNDEYFLKRWFEVAITDCKYDTTQVDEHMLLKKWFPITKGGEKNKWYGNNEFLINWLNNGDELKQYIVTKYGGGSFTKEIRSEHYYFQPSITWSGLSGGAPSFRINSNGFLMSSSGPSAFPSEDFMLYLLAYLNSNLSFYFLSIFSQTLSFLSGDVAKLPINFPKQDSTKHQIEQLTQQNIDISKQEWDSRETSWDFTKNELLKHKQDGSLENALTAYSTYWSEEFNTLHTNEEELNRLFIDIYGLQDELTPDVALEDITILKTEAKIVNGNLNFQNLEIIKQFISYSVGCMLGRYSLDKDGLVVANLNQEIPTDTTYEIDDDNIIPIVDESDYFSDDMTDRFTEFVRTTFGSEKLQQNIAFIEASLGKKIRAYFQKDFYIDHTKRYKKRPIYWLFTSPKGTFQTLIYMHRYTPDTLNNILNDYLRPFRIRLDTMREESMRVTESESASSRDKTDADKKIDKIDKTLDDITEYEKTLAHYAAMRIEIDLDDGVKVNYCKFKELLFEFDNKLCK